VCLIAYMVRDSCPFAALLHIAKSSCYYSYVLWNILYSSFQYTISSQSKSSCSFISHVAGIHDQNKSGFLGGPAFIQPIRAIWKVFKKPWLAGKKPALQKSHFCFDHV